jgi:hypothetical protein
MKTPTPAAAIKWTDEEWGRIADKLHGDKGSVLLHSENLEEIKARDVFEAQQVLPAERHRKLISIAQGFQGIRSRLHTIFQRMQATDSSATALQQQDAAEAFEASQTSETGAAAQDTDVAAQQVLALHEPAEAAPEPQAQQQPEEMEVESVDAVEEEPLSAQPAPRIAQGSAAQSRPAAASEPAQERAAVNQASGDFIELARPFVSMVCEELAKALVKAFAGQAGLTELAAGLRQASAPAPRHRKQDQERVRPQPQPQMEAAPPKPAAPDHFDEDAVHPTEVQPLFDPKLPPSANSDFKPTIGLVATRAHEYEDLQMLYPQLQLFIMQADAIRGPDAFRSCQRIIGLRDEVPQAIDEMLRRGLRHRYVRLNGGVARVREQLNSWLDKPGSINSSPRPQSQQRNDKRQGPGNGKKRHKWPPRADR